jgi:tRNA A37 threonylcarbamoyladenosine biosynthesis protein TsaE
MRKTLSKSLDDTSRIAREWLVSLEKKEAKNKDSALVVGLFGNLGSGKTAFVKAVALILGITESVTSPTFVIEKIYEIGSNGSTFAKTSVDKGNDPQKSYGGDLAKSCLVRTPVQLPWTRLVHIDAYRLESARELEVLNFEKLVEDPNNLILVEWPENVKEILPDGTLTIKCEFMSETEREYDFSATMST